MKVATTSRTPLPLLCSCHFTASFFLSFFRSFRHTRHHSFGFASTAAPSSPSALSTESVALSKGGDTRTGESPKKTGTLNKRTKKISHRHHIRKGHSHSLVGFGGGLSKSLGRRRIVPFATVPRLRWCCGAIGAETRTGDFGVGRTWALFCCCWTLARNGCGSTVSKTNPFSSVDSCSRGEWHSWRCSSVIIGDWFSRKEVMECSWATRRYWSAAPVSMSDRVSMSERMLESRRSRLYTLGRGFSGDIIVGEVMVLYLRFSKNSCH